MQIAARQAMLAGGDVPPEPSGFWGLKFTAEEAGATIKLDTTRGVSASFEYSLDDGDTWNTYSKGSTITLSQVSDNVCFAAAEGVINDCLGAGNSILAWKFQIKNGKVAASGDISSLRIKDKSTSLVLPMSSNCYRYLFSGCTSLTTAPTLSAVTLASACYSSMFNGCTSLTEAPILPAPALENGCYQEMCKNCTSLTKVPLIAAQTPVAYSCTDMFNGCTSLAEVNTRFTSWGPDGTNQTWWWLSNVSATGTMKCPSALGTNETINRGISYCPEGWTVINT